MFHEKMKEQLWPCPFCGGEFDIDSCDRLIMIKCPECQYSRSFSGLVSPEPNDKPITRFKDGDGKVRKIPEEEADEYYHSDAYEKVIEKMNKRAFNPDVHAPIMWAMVVIFLLAWLNGDDIIEIAKYHMVDAD